MTPPARPDLETEALLLEEEREIILLAPVTETNRTCFYIGLRIHDMDAHAEDGDTLREIIGVKEVFATYSQSSADAVIAEAQVARAAGCEVGVDEVRIVDERFGFGTMRLGGEFDVSKAMKFVPDAVARFAGLAHSPKLGRARVISRIAKQVATQLILAHQQVAHLDLKPANIFLSPEGVARVGDYGEGTKLGNETTGEGTHGFMPLEQYGHGSELIRQGPDSPIVANSKSDMWSFGVLLVTALTGRNPFASEYKLPCIRKLELYAAHQQGRAPQTPGHNAEEDSRLLYDVLDGLRDVRRFFPTFVPLISDLLRANPEDRITAQKAVEHLDAIDAKFDEEGPVDWPSFWSTLATLYRQGDPTAVVKMNAARTLFETADALRDRYEGAPASEEVAVESPLSSSPGSAPTTKATA